MLCELPRPLLLLLLLSACILTIMVQEQIGGKAMQGGLG
jgi:hypothetical protein